MYISLSLCVCVCVQLKYNIIIKHNLGKDAFFTNSLRHYLVSLIIKQFEVILKWAMTERCFHSALCHLTSLFKAFGGNLEHSGK